MTRGILATLLALMLAAASGCGDEETTSPSPGGTSGGEQPQLPSELNFTRIEQDEQQQQQTGKCPRKFRVGIDSSGVVTIHNQQQQEIVKGKMSQQDLIQMAIAANAVVDDQPQQQTDCTKSDDDSKVEVAQLFVTDKNNKTDLVTAQHGDHVCDFTKSGKGKELQQQIGKIVQQSCVGILEPVPNPSPTPRPRPSPSPDDNRDCADALTLLREDFIQARKCSVDADCNLIDGLIVIPRTSSDTSVTLFRCGDSTLVLGVANGDYVSTHYQELRNHLNLAERECELGDRADRIIRGCSGEGRSNAQPICKGGSCTVGAPRIPGPTGPSGTSGI